MVQMKEVTGEYVISTEDLSAVPEWGREFRLQTFIFTKETNYLLFQAVRHDDANGEPYGKNYERSKTVYVTLIQIIPSSSWERVQRPTIKMVRDNLQCIFSKWRLVIRWKDPSGIGEIFGLSEELLDDFILEMD